MLRRLLALIALTAVLSSAGCFHHRHFTRHHGDCCCAPACAPCCDGGPAFHGP